MTVATPPLNLLFGLDAALQLMVDEGLDDVWARHQRLGDLARHRVREAGLDLFADPAHASDSLTALRVPDGSTASGLVAQIVAEHNVLLQIGQGALAEKVIRIGHMGWVTDEDVEEACAALAAVTSNLALA